MIDYLRPFLFPITICTIIGCVWALAWNKSIEDQAARVNARTVPSQYDVDPADEAPDQTPAPHGCQATVSIHEE